MDALRAQMLTELRAAAVPDPDAHDARSRLLQCVFDVGLVRAHVIPDVRVVDADGELPRALVQLYRARAHACTAEALESPKAAVLSTMTDPARSILEWWLRRSTWFFVKEPEPPPGIRPALERKLAAASSASECTSLLHEVARLPGLYDYEIVAAIQAMLARQSEAEPQAAATLAEVGLQTATHIRIDVHKLRALGACAAFAWRAGSELGVEILVDACGTLLPRLAGRPRDTANALRPLLEVIAQTPASARLLAALTTLAVESLEPKRETNLVSLLAATYARWGDAAGSDSLLMLAFDAMVKAADTRDLGQEANTFLSAVRRRDVHARFRWCSMLVDHLATFSREYRHGDLTAPTTEIFLAEQVVDMLLEP